MSKLNKLSWKTCMLVALSIFGSALSARAADGGCLNLEKIYKEMVASERSYHNYRDQTVDIDGIESVSSLTRRALIRQAFASGIAGVDDNVAPISQDGCKTVSYFEQDSPNKKPIVAEILSYTPTELVVASDGKTMTFKLRGPRELESLVPFQLTDDCGKSDKLVYHQVTTWAPDGQKAETVPITQHLLNVASAELSPDGDDVSCKGAQSQSLYKPTGGGSVTGSNNQRYEDGKVQTVSDQFK